jgi:hypothetical protein
VVVLLLLLLLLLWVGCRPSFASIVCRLEALLQQTPEELAGSNSYVE